MTAIYDATIFLNIALLAIAVSVFVLAASLLGRALEISRHEEEKLLAEVQKEENETLKRLNEEQTKASGEVTKGRIKQEIQSHEKRRGENERKLVGVKRTYGLIGVKAAVTYPAIFFIVSLSLGAVARLIDSASEVNLFGFELSGTPPFIWALSLFSLAWGLRRVYECLMVVQRVAITSEEAQHGRMTAALRTALEAHDEARRAKLALRFTGAEPPFAIASNAQQKIQFKVQLEQGDIGKEAAVHFLAPQGFEFPGVTCSTRESSYLILPGYLEAVVDVGDVYRGLSYRRTIELKAPSQAGEYKLCYCLFCEGFEGKLEEFLVRVA